MKTCNICHRPISSYYRTRANRILCYDCWKAERERVLHYRDEAMKKHQQEEQQYRILGDRISELERKIYSEEHKIEKNHYYINQLREELIHAMREKRRMGPVGPRLPQIDNDIMTAKYFESEATEYRFLEEKRKAEEEERKRAEKARKAEETRKIQIQKEKERAILKEKNRIIYENEQAVIKGLSSYNGRFLGQNDYMLLAYNSVNYSVLRKLMQRRDIQILEALLNNSTISPEMQREIKRQENKLKQEKEREKEKAKNIKKAKEEGVKKKSGCLSILLIVLFSLSIIGSCFL